MSDEQQAPNPTVPGEWVADNSRFRMVDALAELTRGHHRTVEHDSVGTGIEPLGKPTTGLAKAARSAQSS
ncbi:MAG: hypothetical protein KGJ62_15130 [Armatimonadetes bacterium]|nr:hypothetical protein [Armatimonadota bacterium]MDE2206279.1 hypothetical protein [Armatimonadota bacterium]